MTTPYIEERARWVTCELNEEPGCAHWSNELCDCECHLEVDRRARESERERVRESFNDWFKNGTEDVEDWAERILTNLTPKE